MFCRSLFVLLSLFFWPLCWLTPLSTIFLLYRGGHFHCWRKKEYRDKTTNLPLLTDKLYHIKLYRVRLTWVGLTLFCTDSCKSNYHAITITTTSLCITYRFKLLNTSVLDYIGYSTRRKYEIWQDDTKKPDLDFWQEGIPLAIQQNMT